ncbi:putative disease resistance protein RGA3 [Triticum aestivum]|uniref:putative disease resistance protein RGA3 n=1 Tax=Triticum aestivum TaxID=4565 RepID=UPI001D02639B|nr:putative disease resistance protein RGA3 [Triticum aestivum]
MSLSATGIVTAINECVTLFQWAKSAISSLHSRWSGPQEQSLEDHVLQLESGLQSLRDTLPAMYDLIDKAEWRSHEHGVAKLLPNLNDAMTEAEDLLDEFTWYEKKVQVEGNASQSPFTEFFDTVIQGNFNKLSDVQSRLNLLSSHLENMGICGVTQRFDKLVRPETTSLPNETKIFGRDKELEQLLGYVPAPTNPKRKRATSSINGSTSNQVSNDSRMLILPVLPIVGLGGVGKTTLVQLFCSHQRVLAFYELIIWIYVSDDFDVKRLTKEAIQSCTGNEATSDNLDFLQHALSKHLKNKKFLIVLDDIWDDALKGNGQSWKSFCAPFRNVQEGSMMLVTTRCQKVTKGVRTLEPILLEGLNEYIFWIFFKSCAFGSGSSNNYPELECIGRRILPKLKGSPLAAKTLGRMLSMDLKALHWNFILESELWELRQEDTDILPALRLSYMYLPFYLKQCFAFCAVYPKDYIFQKDCLAKFWVAEGFVESNGGIPVEHIACQYFEDLVARSFFQEIMSYQIVLETGSIFGTLKSQGIVFDAKKCMLESLPDEFWKLVSLRNFELHGLSYHAGDVTTLDSANQQGKVIRLMKNLNQFRGDLEITNVHMLSKENAAEAVLKNKKYLDELILNMHTGRGEGRGFSSPESRIIQNNELEVAQLLQPPISLKSLSFLNYECVSLPTWFFQPQNLPSLKSLTFGDCVGLESISFPMFSQGTIDEISAVRSFVSLTDITIDGCENISSLEHFLHPDYVPAIKKIRVEDCEMLASVPTDNFGGFHFLEELHVARCPNSCSQRLVSPSLKKLYLHGSGLFRNIDCCSLTFFYLVCDFVTSIQLEMWSLPALRELHIRCGSLASIVGSTDLSTYPGTGSIRAFSCLGVLKISHCNKLSTLDDLLTQEYLPAIEKIDVECCPELLSLPGERFGSFSHLNHLVVYECLNLNWQRGLVLPSSLQRLNLTRCGDISLYVPSCLLNLTSLTSLSIAGCKGITSIAGDIWRCNLASLEELAIQDCPDLVSIGGAKAVAEIKQVTIHMCPKCKEANQINIRSRQRQHLEQTCQLVDVLSGLDPELESHGVVHHVEAMMTGEKVDDRPAEKLPIAVSLGSWKTRYIISGCHPQVKLNALFRSDSDGL